MDDDQILELNDFYVETDNKVEYMSQMTRSLSPDIKQHTNYYYVNITISDKFGSISSQLEFDPYNYEITKEQLINLQYFLLRDEYFKIKCDMDIVSYIRNKLKDDIYGYEITCQIRSYKISEYLDLNNTKSQIFYRKKLLRQFYFPKSKIIRIIETSFSLTSTVILYENMNLFLYDIQNGIQKGPFVLICQQKNQCYSQFQISNNGLFVYYDHYLMKKFKIIKYIKCIYVQFRDDSKQVLLCDSLFKSQLYDLQNEQTVFVIYIPIFNDANFTYFNFNKYSLIQDSINKKQRIRFQINYKTRQYQ